MLKKRILEKPVDEPTFSTIMLSQNYQLPFLIHRSFNSWLSRFLLQHNSNKNTKIKRLKLREFQSLHPNLLLDTI